MTPRLIGASTRQQDIIKVLPHVRTGLQINDHRGLLSAAINKELHSAHELRTKTVTPNVKRRPVHPRVAVITGETVFLLWLVAKALIEKTRVFKIMAKAFLLDQIEGKPTQASGAPSKPAPAADSSAHHG